MFPASSVNLFPEKKEDTFRIVKFMKVTHEGHCGNLYCTTPLHKETGACPRVGAGWGECFIFKAFLIQVARNPRDSLHFPYTFYNED